MIVNGQQHLVQPFGPRRKAHGRNKWGWPTPEDPRIGMPPVAVREQQGDDPLTVTAMLSTPSTIRRGGVPPPVRQATAARADAPERAIKPAPPRGLRARISQAR